MLKSIGTTAAIVAISAGLTLSLPSSEAHAAGCWDNAKRLAQHCWTTAGPHTAGGKRSCKIQLQKDQKACRANVRKHKANKKRKRSVGLPPQPLPASIFKPKRKKNKGKRK